MNHWDIAKEALTRDYYDTSVLLLPWILIILAEINPTLEPYLIWTVAIFTTVLIYIALVSRMALAIGEETLNELINELENFKL